jgi:glycosyltransferase involved in cell wall biosynthesis
MIEIAIIIPAYNEELTISQTILDFFTFNKNFFIVVVNNNSTDNTLRIASDIFLKNKIQGKILTENRKGKAFAVRTAFHSIDAKYYVLVDADTTYKAKDFDHLYELLIINQADMIVGDRHKNGHTKKRIKEIFINLEIG